MARKDSIVSLERNVKARSITVTVAGFAPLSFSLTKFVYDADWSAYGGEAPEILIHAALHGIGQKLVDAAAKPRDTGNGAPATPAEKYEAIRAVYDRLLAGEWNAPAGSGGGNEGGLLAQALVRLYPTKTREQINAYLAGKSDKEKAALRADPNVAPIIAEIRAAAGKVKGAGVDTASLLDELAGEEG